MGVVVVKCNTNDISIAYALSEVLDINAAQSLREGLIEVGTTTERIVVDGSQVDRIATPAVQILLAAAREFSAEGRSFSVHDASQPLVSAFEDLGLAEDLKRWSSC